MSVHEKKLPVFRNLATLQDNPACHRCRGGAVCCGRSQWF